MALFLGRLHPHKNLELLLRCWAKLVAYQLALCSSRRRNPKYTESLLALRKTLDIERS